MKAVAIVSSAVLLLFIGGSVSSHQGSAVSIGRCRSDLASWTNNFSYRDTAGADSLLTFDQLTSRMGEAKGCRVMDSNEPYHTAADIVQTNYNAFIRDRLYHFVERHNLTEQFKKEDADGLR